MKPHPILSLLFRSVLIAGSGLWAAGSDVQWSGGSGDWTTADKWEGGALPTVSDLARVEGAGEVLVGDKVGAVGALVVDDRCQLTVGPIGVLEVGGDSGDKAVAGGSLSIGRGSAGLLQIRGGKVSVKGAVTGGSEEDFITKILVTSGGTLTVGSFSDHGGISTIQIGPESTVSTLNEGNSFGGGRYSKMQFQLAGGSLATAGVDNWGAARTIWKASGGTYRNARGLNLGSGNKSVFQGELSGESAIEAAGAFHLGSGVGCTTLLSQAGGRFVAKKSFVIAGAEGARGSYRISGGEFHADTISLGGKGNGLAEFQVIGSEAEVNVNTISCLGTAALGFVTDLNTIEPLEVSAYLDLRSAAKAILKVDLRLRHKQGVVRLIKCPRINGKFTHVEVSAKGVVMEAVSTENLAVGSYRLDYDARGLDIHYRLPK